MTTEPMKDLLKKLSEKMPEGYRLTFGETMYRLAFGEGILAGGMDMYHNQGDIGLAPLTALLKQSLGSFVWPDGDSFPVEIHTPYDGDPRWLVVRRNFLIAPGDIEFEAVANAYLAIKRTP